MQERLLSLRQPWGGLNRDYAKNKGSLGGHPLKKRKFR